MSRKRLINEIASKFSDDTHSEVKSCDHRVATWSFPLVPFVEQLFPLQMGTRLYQRVGRQITMVSLQMRAQLTPQQTPSTVYPADYLRFVIVYDRQSQLGITSVVDMRMDTFADGTTTSDSFSGINMGWKDRFLVIKEICIPTPSYSTDASGNIQNIGHQDDLAFRSDVQFYTREINGLTTTYNGSSTVPTSGGLYLIIQGLRSTPFWFIRGRMRLRYTD